MVLPTIGDSVVGIRFSPDGRRLARRLRDDRADAHRALAGLVEPPDRAVGVLGRDDHRHADAAVEHAVHLRVGDVAVALQPVPEVLVVDVNETLLDLGSLREPFARAFGGTTSLGEWFARLLHGSLVTTVRDAYEDFASIGRWALEAVAARRL